MCDEEIKELMDKEWSQYDNLHSTPLYRKCWKKKEESRQCNPFSVQIFPVQFCKVENKLASHRFYGFYCNWFHLMQTIKVFIIPEGPWFMAHQPPLLSPTYVQHRRHESALFRAVQVPNLSHLGLTASCSSAQTVFAGTWKPGVWWDTPSPLAGPFARRAWKALLVAARTSSSLTLSPRLGAFGEKIIDELFQDVQAWFVDILILMFVSINHTYDTCGNFTLRFASPSSSERNCKDIRNLALSVSEEI